MSERSIRIESHLGRCISPWPKYPNIRLSRYNNILPQNELAFRASIHLLFTSRVWNTKDSQTDYFRYTMCNLIRLLHWTPPSFPHIAFAFIQQRRNRRHWSHLVSDWRAESEKNQRMNIAFVCGFLQTFRFCVRNVFTFSSLAATCVSVHTDWEILFSFSFRSYLIFRINRFTSLYRWTCDGERVHLPVPAVNDRLASPYLFLFLSLMCWFKYMQSLVSYIRQRAEHTEGENDCQRAVCVGRQRWTLKKSVDWELLPWTKHARDRVNIDIHQHNHWAFRAPFAIGATTKTLILLARSVQ